MKILLIRSGALGDVLMTTPAVRAVRKKYPKAEITYLTGKWSAPILEGNPHIDRLIVFDDQIIVKKKVIPVLKLIRALKKEGFDKAFIFDKAWQWGLFVRMCKIPVRYGFSRGWEGRFHTKSIPFDGKKNEIEYNLDLLHLDNINSKNMKTEVILSREDKTAAKEFLKDKKRQGKLIGVIPGGARNPGSVMEEKRWPFERYAQLISMLEKVHTVLLMGGHDDIILSHKITSQKEIHPINATGLLTLKQTIALMQECDIIITHDSGPMHMAYAAGARILALFGPTPKERFAPPGAEVIESDMEGCPCYDIYGKFNKNNCIKGIAVDEVVGKLMQMKVL